MDYKKTAYRAFYDRDGRVWGINLYRRTDSALIARELTFEGDEAAVIEWDEFDLEQPIQGSALTLRIISEADREWITLYTVKDGDVVAEVTLDGELWWRGSLDPETYERNSGRSPVAQDTTIPLRNCRKPKRSRRLCEESRNLRDDQCFLSSSHHSFQEGRPILLQSASALKILPIISKIPLIMKAPVPRFTNSLYVSSRTIAYFF